MTLLKTDYAEYLTPAQLEAEMSNSSQQARLKWLGEKAVGKVLDVGCGCGDIIPHLSSAVTEYVGVDVKSEYVERCKERWKDAKVKCAFIQESMVDYCDILMCEMEPKLPNGEFGQFDTIICAEILEHLPHWELLGAATDNAKQKVLVSLPIGTHKDDFHLWNINSNFNDRLLCLEILRKKEGD